MALHFGAAVAVFALAGPEDPAKAFGLALLAFIVTSFVHRTLVQRVFQTTIGKAIFGLVLIRRSDGQPPNLWDLLLAWLVGVLKCAIAPLANDFETDTALPAVRRRDVRRLRGGY